MKPALPVLCLTAILINTATAVPAQSLSEELKRESLAKLATAAREHGDAARGAVLFAEQKLGCINCHAAGRNDLLGPDLSRLGKDVTDASLVEALLQPSKVIRKGFETVTVVTQPGRSISGRVIEESETELVLRDTSSQRRVRRLAKSEIEERTTSAVSNMPDKLADQFKDRQQFLDLMRYVMEVVAAGPTADFHGRQSNGGGVINEQLTGLLLLNEFQCATCHQYDSPTTSLPPAKAPNLKWLSGRIDPQHIAKFIAEPHATKPGTRMPDVLGTLSDEARELAAVAMTHYIVSLSDRDFSPMDLNEEAIPRGRDLFHAVGCVACHSPRDAESYELLADSSVPLGDVSSRYNLDSLVAFLENPHAARPAGRMPNMQLTHWEAVDTANYLLNRKPVAKGETHAIALNPNLAAEGKKQFAEFGCVNCHAVEGRTSAPKQIPIAADSVSDGCLSESVGAWPRFALKPSQRQAIQSALTQATAELTDADRVAMSLTTFRCFNCHSRGTLGGVSDDRNPHFQTTNPNLGPQGRIPPTLTGVGAKLKPQWMRQVLVSGRTIRPYLKTRMPQYGADNVAHLVDLFQRVDQQPPHKKVTFTDQKEMRTAGIEMAGTKGLNCVVCHTFRLKKAATMPAVDLTEMAERLHKDWFHRYMHEPQRFSQNTVMPSFWPGGRAIRKDILGGDPDLQVEALWQYLREGRQARAPHGLIREPMELLATEEAVMLRRSYRGIGKRGIGVGYPAKVNLAFDAEQMRLAMIWTGKFADPGGVWNSQGHGTVRPLSRNPVQFTNGPDVDDADSPWIVDEGRPPRHRFKGYSLDEKRRPKFEYQIGDVIVEDYSTDVTDPASKQPFLRRTLTLRSSHSSSTLTLRAADGKKVSAIGDGEFLLDGLLRVRMPDVHDASVVSVGEGQQIRVPLSIRGGDPLVVVIEYVWARR